MGSAEEIHLIGAYEIRLLLGVTRQRVYQLIKSRHFPRHYAKLCQGKVWLTEDVEKWILEHRTADRVAPRRNSRRTAAAH